MKKSNSKAKPAKSAGKRSRRKKTYTKVPGRFTPYQLRQFKAAGLPEPLPETDTKSFAKLQQHWYSKAASGDDFKDIEWVDHATGQGHNSPHLRGSLALGKTYHPGRELYYAMASNYLQHCKALRGYNRFIWKLHVDGVAFEAIVAALAEVYKDVPSLYTVYYDIKHIATLSYKWNCAHPEGLLLKRHEDRQRILESHLSDIFATEYNYIIGEEPL